MRFFRIPGFTGIEAHRDDADRGSLRVVEGCLPFGTGGLRSGPVWKKIGHIDHYGDDDRNHVSAADDGNGNSMIFVSRNCEIHDLVLFSEENTKFESLGISYDVAVPVEGMFSRDDATISSIGNRLYAIGDGSQEAMYIGKGPVGSGAEVYPDETLYTQEWSRFPKCQYYARGPKATIFAAGNPDKPLTVYISEPAGLTSSFKDSPYSTEDTSDLYNAGKLSTVDILGSDASKITALSTRGEQVVVHTDKGAYLLYAPTADQASTGYRVEQAPATNFSSAVNHKVVSGEGGTQTFWIGHDGQVYKDEAASRGSAELKSNSDQDQANWKSKGVWEHELPTDLSGSFSTFSGQTGNYFFFVESDEAAKFNFNDGTLNGIVDPNAEPVESYVYVCGKYGCGTSAIANAYPTGQLGSLLGMEGSSKEQMMDALSSESPFCCKKIAGLPNPAEGLYETCKECQENSSACNDTGCCCQPHVGINEEFTPHSEETLDSWGMSDWFKDAYATIGPFCCADIFEGSTTTWTLSNDQNFGQSGCTCTQTEDGTGYPTYAECIAAALASGNCTWDYTDCGPCENIANGSYFSEESCKEALAKDTACEAYDIVDCECKKNESGSGAFASLADCETELNSNTDYENCWKYLADESSCSCSLNSAGIFNSSSECEDYLLTLESCVKYDLNGCDCVPSLTGVHDTIEACEAEADKIPQCLGYKLEGCTCVVDDSDNPEYESLELCEAAAQSKSGCDTWDLVECECTRNDLGTGSYPSLELCEEDASSTTACKKYTILDCQCIESETGTITGKSVCETILEANTECKKYTLTSDCECIEDDAGSFESLGSCEIERQKCAEYEIFGCTCTESEGGSYTGLEACHAALDETPYDEDCTGYGIVGCSCVADPSGPFSTMSDCQTVLEIDEACNGFWRFPKPFKFDGVAQENPCECYPTSIDGEGMFSKYGECQSALSIIRPREEYPSCWSNCLYDVIIGRYNTLCCECEEYSVLGARAFNNPNACSKQTLGTPSKVHHYCSSKGGSFYYIEAGHCDDGTYSCYKRNQDGDLVNVCRDPSNPPEDFVNGCKPQEIAEPGDEICEECPEAKYIIEFPDSGGCGCVQRVPTEQDLHVYDTENECLDARLAICGAYKANTSSCTCEPVYDGSGTSLEDCEALLDNTPGCERHTISDSCECVQDAAGIFRGVINCESNISSDPNCQPHWIDNCTCTSTDPNNGTPSFNGEVECLTHLDENHPECFCDDTANDYFVDDFDGTCINIGGGNGTHTECQCREENRGIWKDGQLT